MDASIVLITSSARTNSNFGTGFIVHQAEDACFVLTCAHVIHDVGGRGKVRVEGRHAAVAAMGEIDLLDVALVRVKGLVSRPCLDLGIGSHSSYGSPFLVLGFQEHADSFKLKPIRGTLGDAVQFAQKGSARRVSAWELSVECD